MPRYDFLCLHCHRPFEVFFSYEEYGRHAVTCLHCGSKQVKRRISRPRLLKSNENLMDDLEDSSALAGLEEDPRALGKMMRRMGDQLGEEIPPEFDEVVDRLEKGQSPEEIEKEIPGLAGEEGGSPIGEE